MQLEFNFFIFWACKWDIVPLRQETMGLLQKNYVELTPDSNNQMQP